MLKIVNNDDFENSVFILGMRFRNNVSIRSNDGTKKAHTLFTRRSKRYGQSRESNEPK